MAEANVTSNKQLPPEVLVKIFEHCDLDQLVNIVDVCQLWRNVATTLVNDLVIRRPDDINNLVSLLCKPVSFSKLHIVWDIPRDEDCSDEDKYIDEDYKIDELHSNVSLDALANATSLTHLQSFTLKIKGGFEEIDNSEVLEALLTLLPHSSADTLTHLNLINTGYNISRKVVELLQACQHLSHLVVYNCGVEENAEQSLDDVVPTLNHLELVDLRGSTVEHSMSLIAAIKRGCPNISNNIWIDLIVRPSDDVSMLQFVCHGHFLGLIDDFNTNDFGSLIGSLSERDSRLSLDELWLRLCNDHLTDDILLSLVQRLRGLKYIDATGCEQLTNEGVVNAIRSSPQLERISISHIININRDIIQLLDGVVSEQNVHVSAYHPLRTDEMRPIPGGGSVYTGKNKNIWLSW